MTVKRFRSVHPRKVVPLKRNSFLEDHSRAFTIIGAIIVLFTFLVKEVFRETVKELRDSLAEARRVELEAERNDNSVLDDVNLRLRLGQIQSLLAAARVGGTLPGSNLLQEVADTTEVLANAEQRFDRVSGILDKLPGHTEALKANRDKLQHDLSDLKKNVNDSLSKGLHAKEQGPINHVLVLVGLIQVLVLDIKLVPLQTAVVETARRAKERAAAAYDTCSYTFWTLHLIGWGIGLTGLIYGKKRSL